MHLASSRIQIALHWIVVVFIPVQYLTRGSVERTHHAVRMGMEPDGWDIVQHLVHNCCGMAIGFLMGVRLQASLGFIASYLTFSVAPLHVAGSWVILVMVALHVAAAAWHTLVLRDGTLDRMKRLPEKTAAE